MRKQEEKKTTNISNHSGKWWLPETGIIRESVLMVSGDPQTPGWPSLGKKVHKIKKEDFMPQTTLDPNSPFQPIGVSVPNIPVQPIGYDTAREIMKRLGKYY